MTSQNARIDIHDLVRRYGRTDAVNGLSLQVEAGRCYGLFGRNGAGKTTTIKCLLNLLRPTAGEVRVFGLDPQRDEVAVKSRLAYVPDTMAFYPWMTVRQVLDYFAAFRTRWNGELERALLEQFHLEERQKAIQKIYARFGAGTGHVDLPGARVLRRQDRELELVANGNATELVARLRAFAPEALTVESLSLEDIFVNTVHTSSEAA